MVQRREKRGAVAERQGGRVLAVAPMLPRFIAMPLAPVSPGLLGTVFLVAGKHLIQRPVSRRAQGRAVCVTAAKPGCIILAARSACEGLCMPAARTFDQIVETGRVISLAIMPGAAAAGWPVRRSFDGCAANCDCHSGDAPSNWSIWSSLRRVWTMASSVPSGEGAPADNALSSVAGFAS